MQNLVKVFLRKQVGLIWFIELTKKTDILNHIIPLLFKNAVQY